MSMAGGQEGRRAGGRTGAGSSAPAIVAAEGRRCTRPVGVDRLSRQASPHGFGFSLAQISGPSVRVTSKQGRQRALTDWGLRSSSYLPGMLSGRGIQTSSGTAACPPLLTRSPAVRLSRAASL